MKRYITITKLKKRYPTLAIEIDNNTPIEDASWYLDTITKGWIEENIDNGNIIQNDADGIVFAPGKELDNALGKKMINAVVEALGVVAKFSYETGYSFITGSTSMGVGSESFAESLDFESSLKQIKQYIIEMLSNYDFGTVIFEKENLRVGFEEDANYPNGKPIEARDRPLTETGLTNRLTDKNWFTPGTGIDIEMNVPGSPSNGIKISATPMDKADDIVWLTDKYADIADFINRAPNYSVVKYNTDLKGNPVKGIMIMKTSNTEAIEFPDLEDTIKIMKPFFAPREYDYSGASQTMTLNTTGGKRFQIISKPAGADDTPIGAINKIKITNPADPASLPQDTDQITYGVDLIWIVKANGDIMQWSEIKNEVAKGSIMNIKHLDNGHWELVKWDEATSGGGSTGITWKDITATYKTTALTQDDLGKKIKITSSNFGIEHIRIFIVAYFDGNYVYASHLGGNGNSNDAVESVDIIFGRNDETKFKVNGLDTIGATNDSIKKVEIEKW